MRKRITIPFILLCTACLILTGCSQEEVIGVFYRSEEATPSPTAGPTSTPEPTMSPEELAAREALEHIRQEAVEQANALAEQYFYDEAIALLSDPSVAGGSSEEALRSIEAQKNALVPYTGELRHIFFHSLIVYPEMIFTDRETPMGGYNAGFSEKAELERILPQLYEKGYVLYDLNECYERVDGKMQRKEILLPEGKTPLILSVDDVAYAYGAGYAQKLYVSPEGKLLYEVPNPAGGIDTLEDGDVMGVVDLFVREHPDFAWHGHKGTLALTGFQGAFGYPDYEDAANIAGITAVAEALKQDGWSFASHSYTHNSGDYGFWGEGCLPEKIQYDINKWWQYVTPCLGETNLFIAPFGYRCEQPGLQYILDLGFDIYCTVNDHVVNELYDDYALMSRIEIGGYSMTHYQDTLNSLFFDVASVFDDEGRPPVE